MASSPGFKLSFVSDKEPDDSYKVATEELRAKNDAQLVEIVARLTANQPVTIGSVTISAAGIERVLIDSTNFTREAIQAFGWAKVQADPHAPPMDLLKVRPDISGAFLGLSATDRDRCRIDIAWSTILGASLPDKQGQSVRVAFQLTDDLRSRYGDCIQSTLPAGSTGPNLAILNPKQFVTLTFESIDEAFVFAETVNQRRG